MSDVPELCIICDTRENLAWDFKSIKPTPPKTIKKKLDTGDYSICGFQESGITIERKSLADAFGSIGKNRARFVKEMERMSSFNYSAIIIEAEIQQWFNNPPVRSKMGAKSVLRSLMAWSQRYGVHIWPAWNRSAGEKFCYILLKRYYDDFVEGKIDGKKK